MNKLNSPVLVLNKFFRPMQIIDAKSALLLLFSEKATVCNADYQLFSLDEWLEITPFIEDCEVVRSISLTVAIPEIIRLETNTKEFKPYMSLSRQNIYIRDNYKCLYCGRDYSHDSKSLTLDHVIPKYKAKILKISFEELRSWENLATCCKKCNQKKGNKTPEEAGMKLLEIPKEPNCYDNLRFLAKEKWRESWTNFIN